MDPDEWDLRVGKLEVLKDLGHAKTAQGNARLEPHVGEVLNYFNAIPGLVTIASCEGHGPQSEAPQWNRPLLICRAVEELWEWYKSNLDYLLSFPKVHNVRFTNRIAYVRKNGVRVRDYDIVIELTPAYCGESCIEPFKQLAKTLKDLCGDKCTTVPIPIIPPFNGEERHE